MATTTDQTATQRKLALKASELDTLVSLFAADPQRAVRYQVKAAGILLDYSKNRIDDDVLSHLMALAEQQALPESIAAMFAGDVLNNTEKRPVLHTALRQPRGASVKVNGQDVMPEVHATLDKMAQFCDQVHSGAFCGHTGKPLRTIVNIGIGGSFLGPKLVSDALMPYWQSGYDLRYMANIDGTDFAETVKGLDPETTLFVICSKSFNTLETLKNAEAARQWFYEQGGTPEQVQQHFVAVTTNIAAATQFGISADNLFPMWDWVGGRYSLWSAVGLPQALVMGFEHFSALLSGAHDMDEHFRTAPLDENIPVLLGLLGVWYQNYMQADSHAVLVYDTYLKELPNHLQQLDMESNGKRVTKAGVPVTEQTGAVIWGGTGTNGQHAYHQLLHQGTRLIPCDFIMPLKSHHQVSDHHDWLFANYLAQQQALAFGKTEAAIIQELTEKGMTTEAAQSLAPHKVMPGNKPCNSILFDQGTPARIGALIAMYEHKVAVQGVMWGINSFDQWGVELGKVLGEAVFDALNTGDVSAFDSSSVQLISLFRESK
jgi:glucose-6-phosphate isomerase